MSFSALEFRALDPLRPVRIYHRDLPHWRQDGATYFVTFRLADSIPLHILQQWSDERDTWLQAHGLRGDIPEPEYARLYRQIPALERRLFERAQAHRLFAEIDRGHGCCLLRRPDVAAIVRDSLLFFHGQRYWCGDFVVMPNHVHWVVQPSPGHELESILHSVKRYAATMTGRRKLHQGRFWQRESYDHLVRDREELRRIRQYIQANPQKAGLSETDVVFHSVTWLDP